MISVEYQVQIENRLLLNLSNRVLRGARDSMQAAVDLLVDNIKARFDEPRLAETVTGTVDIVGGDRENQVIVGKVSSTWANMVHYERGRKPGGRLPPLDKIGDYARRKGIQPDAERTKLAFAFAINARRARDEKHRIPIQVLVDWQTKTGVVPSEKFAFDSMVFAMAKVIQRDGIPGHHHFQDGLADSRQAITDAFERVTVSATGF